MCEMWLNKFIFIAASRTTHTRFYTCPLCRHKRHIALSLTLTLSSTLTVTHTLLSVQGGELDHHADIAAILAENVGGSSAGWSCRCVGVLEARKMLLPGLVHDPQLAVLEARALEAPVFEEDAPARARVLVSLRLAWAKSSQGWG